MGDAIGQLLSSAMGIALSPLPLMAVILLLATPRGRVNGIAFTAGWTGALAAVVTVVVLAAVASGVPGGGAVWYSKLAVGLLLLLLGLRQWRDRPRPGHVHSPPKWMRKVDRFTPGRSAGLAALLVVANPKNLALAVGGAVSVATSAASAGGRAVAAAVLVLVGSLCTLLPLAVHLCGGAGAAKALGEWNAWMATHNSAIMMVVLTVLGAQYVGDAVSGLTV